MNIYVRKSENICNKVEFFSNDRKHLLFSNLVNVSKGENKELH